MGDCYGMGDALLIRSVLAAHGIEAIIPGLSSGTGAYTSGYSSQILVDERVAEEAKALIAQALAGSAEDPAGEEDEGDPADPEAHAADDDGRPPQRSWWRVQTAAMAFAFPFGTAHLINRAYGRAILLAGAQTLALMYLFAGSTAGALAVITVPFVDAIGSASLAKRRVAAKASTKVPAARVVKSS